ncbi:MAG TPA: hypothetical protein VEA16_03975 [Vicinamibacterales bacterium]|nr:hypothetical protein [Vicinamibacterales bacterium]
MTDWVWSTALYVGALGAMLGALGVVWPLRSLHRKSRKRALVMLAAGLLLAFAVTQSRPSATDSTANHAIDEFAPRFHFRERHELEVAAPPDRVYAAIKAVAADDISLFNLFTSIRRFGRPGPESILNAPGRQPILDVATRTGFLMLADRPPREVVIGAVVVAPPGARGARRLTTDEYKSLSAAGFAKATMNFRVEDAGNGKSRVITETRIFATDGTALRRFTPYWRIIFPGSAILRLTWLRAVRDRGQQSSS